MSLKPATYVRCENAGPESPSTDFWHIFDSSACLGDVRDELIRQNMAYESDHIQLKFDSVSGLIEVVDDDTMLVDLKPVGMYRSFDAVQFYKMISSN
eukprot:839691_1